MRHGEMPIPANTARSPRFGGKLLGGHWTFLMQSLIEAERVSHLDERDTGRKNYLTEHRLVPLLCTDDLHPSCEI